MKSISDNKEAFTENLLESNMSSLNSRIVDYETNLTEYSDLGKNLLKLSEKSSAQVMMPLNDIAFMPSRLKHTNEIYVHLGDGYFVQRTAMECQGIINRRKEMIEQNLDSLKSELEKQTGIKDLFTNENLPSQSEIGPTNEIPETHWSKEGFLEINEPYEEKGQV